MQTASVAGEKRKKQSIPLASYKSLAVNILCLWHLVIQLSAPSLNMHIAPLSCIPSCGYLGTNMKNCGGKKEKKKGEVINAITEQQTRMPLAEKLNFVSIKCDEKHLAGGPSPTPFDWWAGNVILKQHGIVYFIAEDGENGEKNPKQRYHVLPI